MDLVIRGGTVATGDGVFTGNVGIRDGRVVALWTGAVPAALEELDATGKLVIPGGVDPHVHLEATSQGTRTADDFQSGSEAAALGGTTTVIDFAYQSPSRSLRESVDDRLQLAQGHAVIDFGFHLVLTSLHEDDLPRLAEVVADGICSFKLYLAYPRRGMMADDATLFRALDFSRRLGAICLIHAENGTVNDVLIERALAEGRTGPEQHPRTRPSLSEAEGTHRAVALARMAEAPVYFVHVSSTEALEEVVRARARGQIAVGETCMHYLLLNNTQYDLEGFESAKFVMNPPLRNDDDREALWDALRLNHLQVVSTDHCPFDYDGQKDLGRDDFSRIPNGVPGIRHRVELLFSEGVASGRLTIPQWVDLVATRPARIMGLAHKGRIALGADADIALFDPSARWTIRGQDHHMNVDYSAYEGRRVTGRVDTVLSRGEVIVRDGALVAAPGRGRFVHRADPVLV